MKHETSQYVLGRGARALGSWNQVNLVRVVPNGSLKKKHGSE